MNGELQNLPPEEWERFRPVQPVVSEEWIERFLMMFRVQKMPSFLLMTQKQIEFYKASGVLK